MEIFGRNCVKIPPDFRSQGARCSEPIMSNTRTLSTSLGHKITVFTDDHVGDKIASQGLHEPENLGLLIDIVGKIPNALVLDIGANIGNHTLALATRAAAVHAFEPIPAVHALLQQNIAQNRLANVHAHCLALSDTNATDTIYVVQSGDVGASSFDLRSSGGEPIQVSKRRGDDFLQEQKLGKVALVKLDVEAHEVFVLRGLREMLLLDRPWITMEWNDPLTIERLRNSTELGFLTEHYTIWVLGSNFDRNYWRDRPFGFLRRKWRRLFRKRQVLLYPFDASRLYKNLLLVPRGQEDLLEQRYFQP
jgi:FkbM family methyltransferase